MLKLAHIINPVKIGPQSDLYIAQPITFETMRRARAEAQGIVDVQLFTTQYPEDHEILPDGFTVLPDLDRSALDIGQFQIPRKLPLLKDILDRLYEATDADYLIYTNVDIAVMPAFYVTVAKMLEAHDAFVINRRNIPDHYSRVEDLLLMYAEAGEKYHGNDTFVFKRDHYPQYVLGDVLIGMSGLELPLYANLVTFASRFKEYEDCHLTFHIGDSRTWGQQKYEDYTEHNRQQLAKCLVPLREVAGGVDPSTGLGRFLLNQYQRNHFLDPLADFLLLDNAELPYKRMYAEEPIFRERLAYKFRKAQRWIQVNLFASPDR